MTETSSALRLFTCHKQVHAAKIATIREMGRGLDFLIAVDGSDVQIRVSADYVQKHAPQPGGYYVRYEDGYESWSPAAVFEAGYTPGEGLRATVAVQIQALRHAVNEATALEPLQNACVTIADALDDLVFPPITVVHHSV